MQWQRTTKRVRAAISACMKMYPHTTAPWRQHSLGMSILLTTALICTTAPGLRAQSVPLPVVATTTTTVGTGLSQPQGVGVDASGDVFVASASAGSVVEFPANGSASINIMTGLSYNKGLAVDSLGNVYSTSYSGNVVRWTAGGAASSGVNFASGSTCPDFAAMGYYLGFFALSADGKGNIYALGGNKYILEFSQQGNCTELLTPSQLNAAPGAIAADAAGDVYYAVGTSIYYLPVGSSTPTQVAITPGAIAGINGLAVDSAGDLIITDSSSIDEVPMVQGSLQPANLTYLVGAGAAANAAVSASGALYYGNFNANSVVRSVIGSLSLGASAVGTTGTAGVITYTFNAAETPTAFQFIAAGAVTTQFALSTPAAGATNTCTTGTAYAASTASAISACTLNVVLNATQTGRVTGTVQLATAAGTQATTYLAGTGQGAALAVDPGLQSTLGNFNTPAATSVDAAGDIFVADSGAGTVTEFTPGSSTGLVVGTGLSAPQGVAVDAAGNLFIADTGNNRVVEVPFVHGALSTAGQSVVASGLNEPTRLAIDLTGNILIANTGGGTLLELPNQGGVVGTLPPFPIGTGLKHPTAVAVDANGNIFVADATLGSLLSISTVGQQTTVLANQSPINGLAVDANDDLYVAYAGATSVTKIALISGAYATNTTLALGTGLQGPQGVALDPAGNLYIADGSGGAAYELQRTLGSLNFGKINVGSSSAAQALTLADIGNASLTFGAPLSTATSGNTADFALTAAANNGCASSLGPGASCGLSVTFTPSLARAETATYSLQSNATNSTSIAATLTGVGANSAPTSLSLSLTPTGQISFGQSIQVTATITSTSGSGATPTGTVQFTVDGIHYGAAVALGSAAMASIPITGLSGGQHTIDATYSGDNIYASSSSVTPLSFTVTTAATTTTVTAIINGSTAVATGTSATFTFTVQPTGTNPPPYPSGTVTFYQSGSTTALGSAALANGVAKLTTTSLPNGQYNVVAVYSGDTDYASSQSAGYAIYVSPPTFLFTVPAGSLTIPAHGSAALSFILTPIAGYTGTVYPSCSGLPKNATCSFTPGGVDFAVTPGAQTITLTVQTGTAGANFAGLPWMPTALLASLFAFVLGWKRRRMTCGLMALLLLAVALTTTITGCSSGNTLATPAGSSTVTVQLLGTAASSSSSTISQSFTFNLQVQ